MTTPTDMVAPAVSHTHIGSLNDDGDHHNDKTLDCITKSGINLNSKDDANHHRHHDSDDGDDRMSIDDVNDDDNGDDDDDEEEDNHATTYSQTVVHLVKGYIGCGILSLPWAVSQLGITVGLAAIVTMSLWSSYNCWTVVRLKRYIERNELFLATARNGDDVEDQHDAAGGGGGGGDDDDDNDVDDGVASSVRGGAGGGSRTGPRSLRSRASTVSSRASTNVTYPDVGEWAYGLDFQTYVAACICTQQLAICTVFLSFVGENVYAVLRFLNLTALQSHEAAVSCCVPAIVVLSCIPSVKQLTPVMMAGIALIFAGFSSLGMIGALEWQNRPPPDEWPTLNPIKAPMALCGILYSFEGICIILPVESAMQEPRKFLSAFVISMSIVTALLCGMAGLSIIAFGEVTNGSITAFLLEEYGHDDTLKLWLMISNILVSLSIVLTYPLQLFPAVELIAPIVQKYSQRCGRRCGGWCFGGGKNEFNPRSDDAEEHDLIGFEPLGEIPEHDVASLGSIPSHHDYGTLDGDDESSRDADGAKADRSSSNTNDGAASRSISRLSSMGQSVVEYINPHMQLPGDSLLLRACLVLGTYTIALVVPNVEALVSLAGAIAGSSTALLIPPILELALIRHLEQRDRTREMTSSGHAMIYPHDWEGGSSEGSRPALLKTDARPGNAADMEAFPFIGLTRSPRCRHRGKIQSRKTRRNKYILRKVVSWCLLIFGITFALFGSYFSVQDIVSLYLK